VTLRSGTSLSIPLGASFQFRATGTQAFAAVGVMLPPWPGPDEAEIGDAPWKVT
jgi:mannose-6-phosphate isomerase-like protein (cupin superfamily)